MTRERNALAEVRLPPNASNPGVPTAACGRGAAGAVGAVALGQGRRRPGGALSQRSDGGGTIAVTTAKLVVRCGY
jgi:hypothetical protein